MSVHGPSNYLMVESVVRVRLMHRSSVICDYCWAGEIIRCNCHDEIKDWKLIQIRAPEERSQGEAGWHRPILVGPNCFRYLTEGRIGDWRYARLEGNK